MRDSLRQLRRGQIIAAARTVVAGRGLSALSFSAVEEAAGCSRGVISYHFAGKDDLVDAVLQSALDEIDSATAQEVRASATLEERVRAVLHSKVAGFTDHPEAAQILVSFWGRIGADPAIRRRNAAVYARYREQSSQLVEAAGAAVDAPALAALLVGMVIGIVTQAYFEPGAIDAAAAVDEATAAVVARLRSAGPRRPQRRPAARAAPGQAPALLRRRS